MVSSIGNRNGFQLVEVVVSMAIVAIAMFMMLSASTFFPRQQSKEQESIDVLFALERSLLSAIERGDNFITPDLRMRLQDGSRISSFEIFDSGPSGVRFTVPDVPLRLTDLRPSLVYYDRDKRRCNGAADPGCVAAASVELSMVMVAGNIDPGVKTGLPEWLIGQPDLISRSRFPIYGFAYRIRSMTPGLLKDLTRGIQGQAAFRIEDHYLPIPVSNYLSNKAKTECSREELLGGIDTDTGNAICLKPLASTCQPTQLAKQLRVRNGQIEIECVDYKSISCPPGYLVQNFSPAALDGDIKGRVVAGKCVFIGAASQRVSRSDPANASISCGANYTTQTPTCQLTDITTTPCQATINGVTTTQEPNPGQAVLTQSAGGFSCTLRRPATVCNAPYAGGTWDALVELSTNCSLTAVNTVDLIGE